MTELSFDAVSENYPYYLIEDTFLNMLIELEDRNVFKDNENEKEVSFEQLNQISESILRSLGNENMGSIIGVIDSFKVTNLRLNNNYVNSKSLFWSTYSYLNFRYNPTLEGQERLITTLEKNFEPKVVEILIGPYKSLK